jgi:hypothetical protein
MKTYYLTNPLQRGKDLIRLQVALHEAKFYFGPHDGIFGAGTAHACETAKYHLGYPRRAIRSSGGQTLLDYLNGSRHLPAAYRARRHARGYGISKAETQREAIVKYALWAAHHEREIHYAQVRPMDHLRKIEVLPWWADCSEFVTTIYKWANAEDPNRRGYDGEGWTGTLLENGIYIPVFQAKPADVAIWGRYPGHHTAVITSTVLKHDPMIVSHGMERGPLEIRLSTENSIQGSQAVIKRYIRG